MAHSNKQIYLYAINLRINKSVEPRTFERKLIWAPDEEVFIYFADTVNREQLLRRCGGGHKKILSLSNNCSRDVHRLSGCSCLRSRLIHHANKAVSNRQPLFCEKEAGCCFQKGPFSLFPGKSVILETKTPPCPHNSLPQPAPLSPLTPNTKQEAQRALHSLAVLIDYITM